MKCSNNWLILRIGPALDADTGRHLCSAAEWGKLKNLAEKLEQRTKTPNTLFWSSISEDCNYKGPDTRHGRRMGLKKGWT